MDKQQNFEFLLEARGQAVTVDDVKLTTGSFDKSCVEGIHVKNGEARHFLINQKNGAGTAGTLSLFAGREKVGTLNWDCTGQNNRDAAYDWTPLSKNFRTTILGTLTENGVLGMVKLRVAQAITSKMPQNPMVASTGLLGFSGV